MYYVILNNMKMNKIHRYELQSHNLWWIRQELIHEDTKIIEFESRYKTNDIEKESNFVLEELRQIEEQIKDENIKIEDNKVFVNLSINIEDSLEEDNKEIIFVSYSYKKNFEKDL